MIRFIFYSIALTLIFSGCKASGSVSQSKPAQQQQTDASTMQAEEPDKYFSEIFIEAEALSYNGYEIVKLKKKAKEEYPPEMQSKPRLIDVFYTALKRNGRVLAEFNDFQYGIGNSNDFGLFSFLGGEAKQLAISQAAPRSGRHWIVDLSSEFRVIFDSYEWEVGREEVWVQDLDKDGVYEIFLADPSFYLVFESLSMAETPLPETIFKYDEQAKKYLPANHPFQDYYLRGIDEEAKKLRSEHEGVYLSDRLRILLRYLYAGKEDEGWSFFDRDYTLADKEEVKSKVRNVLNKHPFYRYISRKRAA